LPWLPYLLYVTNEQVMTCVARKSNFVSVDSQYFVLVFGKNKSSKLYMD
jgi:hypothetical protein